MGSSNIIKINCSKRDSKVLYEATEKFKRIYKVDFQTNFDETNNVFQVDLESVSDNNAFMIGYYYGALQFIEAKKKKS